MRIAKTILFIVAVVALVALITLQARKAARERALRKAVSQVTFVIIDDDVAQLEQLIKKEPRLLHWRWESGSTLLHVACRYNAKNTIVMLLDRGLDINAENYDQQTPLFNSLFQNKPNEELIGYLIDHGATLNFNDGTSSRIYGKYLEVDDGIAKQLARLRK